MEEDEELVSDPTAYFVQAEVGNHLRLQNSNIWGFVFKMVAYVTRVY